MDKKIYLGITIFISILSVIFFLGKGLPPTHDGEYHVIRFYEFDKSLRDGNLYPRWAPDLNNDFGIPLFNYVYPLPNYVAASLHDLGFSFIDSFKLNMLFATIIGSLFMFLWAREFWGDLGGLVSSAFYSFSPYRILDIYIRGSVGEVWALALFPGFLWAITKYSKKQKNKYAIFSSVLLALVIFSHNILALMFFVFGILYILLFLLNKKTNLTNYVIIIILGVTLSSVFWLPAIFEQGFVRGLEIYDYSQNFPELYQLLIPSWGSGFSNGSLQNQLSFQIGIANLLVILFSVSLLFKKSLLRKAVLFMIVSFLIVIFLMLKISDPIWRNVPLMNFFQFPWRFLSLEMLIAPFLAGGLVLIGKPKIVSIVLILAVILLGIGYAHPAYFHQRDDNYYTTRSNFIDGTNSPGNAFNTLWFKDQPKQKNRIVSNANVQVLEIKSTEYRFKISTLKNTRVLINTAFFPGWTAYVDGKQTLIEKTENGTMALNILPGEHETRIVLGETNIQRFATFLSLISLTIILFGVRRSDRIKR